MKTTRRSFIKSAGATAIGAATAVQYGCSGTENSGQSERPNVIMIMTDDQGYGDIGFHGNDIIRTPNVDRFAAENIEFTRFYVCPVCTPTRAGLLTGRYHHRTGAMGVMSGECLINPEEATIAGLLGGEGYRTGIFGKWHLGDNYPRRPMDMGFDEMIVHNAGGMSQPSCPPGVGYGDPEHEKKYNYTTQKDKNYRWMSSNNYFDPVLNHNGAEEQYEGYCTDIFFNEAMSFIEDDRDAPFFAYLPLNAPHCPEIISDDYADYYRDKGLDDHTARIYGMIENIDDNFGRLRKKLDELDLTGNTILIFFCDNGPFGKRFNSGLRGAKGSFYEGGIKVPFVMSWPEKIKEPGKRDIIAANIDMLPTILDACGVPLPADRKIDGRSLLPLLTGDDSTWPERTVFFQGNSGIPERYNHCAVEATRYKLVDGRELYDIEADPGETNDIAGANPDIVKKLRNEYEGWFEDVCGSTDFGSQRLWLGTEHENPVRLTRSDWKGPRSRFVGPAPYGWWDVDIKTAGNYNFVVRVINLDNKAQLTLKIGDITESVDAGPGTEYYRFGSCKLAAGEAKLDCWIEQDGEKLGVYSIGVEKVMN